MPKDGKGNFHLNTQRANAADKMGSEKAAPKAPAMPKMPAMPAEHEQEAGGASTTLHDHGDGTFHTESHDGEQTEHPHIGHALMHMAAKHGGGGKHMHIQHDGMGPTSHHVGEDGQVEGPHDHENIEALKDHLGQFFDEEQNEGAGHGEHPPAHAGY